MASASSDIDVALEELEARLERLRALYEQYFIGIEKIEPSVPRQDVDRRIYALRKVQIRNTAKRFKLQTIIQRYNAFQQYWLRICREIENGTYHRHVARAQSRFGDVPLTAAARRRARLQVQSQTSEEKAAVEEKAKARKEADDDLEALLGEDLDVALSRALLAADDVELIRVEPGAPAKAAQVPTTSKAAAPTPKLASVGPPRPKAVSAAEAAVPAKPLAPKPPPRTKPAGAGTLEATAGAVSPAAAVPTAATTISSEPAVRESPAPRAAAVPPARKAPAQVPSASNKAPAAVPSAKGAEMAARPGPGVPVPAGVAGEVPVAASRPGEGRKKPVPAREAAASKAKPKAAAQADGWAALRMPSAQRQGPERKTTPKSEPARAEASKPRAAVAPPLSAQAAPAASASESKKAAPQPLPAELAPRSPAAQVTTAAPSPRASVEQEAPAPSADARAAAAARRAAAERAAEIRSQAQAAPKGAGMDDQRLSQLHGALVAERRRLNQPGKVSKDALAASLRDTETKLRKQYGDKQIDFHVVVKDGKAVVKPIVG